MIALRMIWLVLMAVLFIMIINGWIGGWALFLYALVTVAVAIAEGVAARRSGSGA